MIIKPILIKLTAIATLDRNERIVNPEGLAPQWDN